MTQSKDRQPAQRATGSCLCGAVRYVVEGALRDVVLCHCTMCRKSHGHIGAYSAAAKTELRVTVPGGLRWYASSAIARRGFCGECGSTLFWDPLAKDYTAIAAGTLHPPTGLRTVLQLHVKDAADYYDVDAQVPVRR